MSVDNLVNENVITAFIDTSAIDPMFNNYNNMEHLFSALRKHIDSHKLVLFTHEIAIREIESHIKERLIKQLETYNNMQKSNEFVLLKANKQYDFMFNDISNDQIIFDTIKALKSKLQEIGIVVLKTGTISIKDLLDDYFSSNPPFGTKSKKAEFPDAIMLQSLLKAVGEEQKTHIIANDGDWENVCKSKKGLFLHKNLNTFLDYINKDNVASSAIKTYLNEPATIDFILPKLDEIVHGIDFNVDGLTCDRKGFVEGYLYDEIELLSVDDISYVTHTIEDIDCTSDKEDTEIRAIVTVVGSANVKVNCTYFDEENSVWDGVDHEYVYKAYGDAIETHEFLFPIQLTLAGDYKKNLEILNYTLLEKDGYNTLDNKTLIEREYVSDYYDPGFCVERCFACPSCNKDFKVDLISDETDCVCSNERQMGFEREYCVDVTGKCPHCGEMYHITGQLWEYPENCYNYEQNIEISKEN